MKNPNSPFNKIKRRLIARWSLEDYPGAQPHFRIKPFATDLGTFALLPILWIIIFKSCENASRPAKRTVTSQQINRDASRLDPKTQIIDLRSPALSAIAAMAKRAPGTLVRVKLLNVVETYSGAPVHAQIVDVGLGKSLLGGTLIGDAASDTNFDRITITFKYARDPTREGVAVPLSARALSLDGTLGLVATKKEGFLTRSTLGSASSAAQNVGSGGSSDFKDILFRALTAGLVQEFGSSSQVEKNRAQVLTLAPSTEFFAELTDFFPGGGK